MSRDIGIDLGTSNVLVSIGGKSIPVKEPSVVAVRKDTGEIVCFGEDAQKILGRAPALSPCRMELSANTALP